MALIKCNECGAEISDKAKTCPKCGCPVESAVNNTQENKSDVKFDDEKSIDQKGKKKLTPIIIAVAAVVFVIAMIFVIKGVSNKKNYEKAIALMEEGKSQEAYDIFVKLGNYKDADKYEDELFGEITFDKAVECLSNGDFKQGQELLRQIPDYPNASELLDLVTSKYPTVSDETYFVGLYLLSEFTSSDYEKTVGDKFKTYINTTFGDQYSKTTMGDISAAMAKQEDVVEMLALIDSIPESGKDDKAFKDLIKAMYLMNMDATFGIYVEGDNDYNCSKMFQLKMKFMGTDSPEICNLSRNVEETGKTLKRGEEDISNLSETYVFIASLTIFDDVIQ